MKFAFPLLIGIAFLALNGLSLTAHAEEADKTVSVQINPNKGPFTDQRPDYLHFKEVTVTREGKQKLRFDITLYGKMPANPKESVSIYVGFDIDQNAATGTVSSNDTTFGQDIGFFIYQNQGDSKFVEGGGTMLYKGRTRQLDITGVKIKDDKIEVSVRSDLFSLFDSFRFFLSSTQRIYDRGQLVNQTYVDTTSPTLF